MKKYILTSALSLLALLNISITSAQSLVEDQNPRYAESRDKYMGMSDSLNQWHGNTFQETYEAFDWYEDKQKRKRDKERFRRELRMERARGYYYPHHGNYGRPGYYRNYNHYRPYNYYRPYGWNWLYLFF